MEKIVRGGQLNTTLGQLAKDLGGELDGPAEFPISGVASAGTNNPNGIAFAESSQYVQLAKESGVGALLLAEGVENLQIPSIRVSDPRLAFFYLLKRSERRLPIDEGIHPTAVVHPDAVVAVGASVGPYAVVERGAKLGANCRIYPFAYVGEDCEVGEGTVVGPHAVLVQDVCVGANSIIHPSAVIGADGFGFAWDGKHRVKIPQVGSVVLGDDVEIGALAAIDRATAGSTSIGNGTKVDNLVQIGHNSSLGDDCAIASLTGISGSTTIGNRVVMAGQCATVDHIKIGDDVTFAGRTAAAQDIVGPGQYIGAPAQPASEGLRNLLLLNRLQDIFGRLRKVERVVKAMETMGDQE